MSFLRRYPNLAILANDPLLHDMAHFGTVPAFFAILGSKYLSTLALRRDHVRNRRICKALSLTGAKRALLKSARIPRIPNDPLGAVSGRSRLSFPLLPDRSKSNVIPTI